MSSRTILNKAILFAKQHLYISSDNTRLIKHCRKSLQFSNNEAWKKKQTKTCFDVLMRILTVQWYANLRATTSYPSNKNNQPKPLWSVWGWNVKDQQIDQMHKNIVKSYKGIGFTINIETNLQVADTLILHSTSRDF